MTYKECIDFLYKSLPMYQRIGGAAYKADLNNTIALLNHIQNPHLSLKTLHIGGSNGKGSVSHNLASILQEAGYVVGLYTSPHLKTFRERIRINGSMIDKDYICRFIEQNKNAFHEIQPSFFEMTVAMAFQYFKEKKVDIAVIEVGMGGRLDSTNVITPELSVVTNISYDHVQFLGKTLADIAKEKAGIIKQQTPIIVGETHTETEIIFQNIANQNNAPIVFADKRYTLKNVKRFQKSNTPWMSFDVYKNDKLCINQIVSPLTGLYQEKNFATLSAAFDALKDSMQLSENDFKKGIKNCIQQTGLQGRWQRLQTNPLCIADVGHNEVAMCMNMNQLQMMSFRKLHFVLGVVDDKDIDTMLSLLPKDAVYYFCKANIPRGLKAGVLKKKAKTHGLTGSCYRSVGSAFAHAKKNAEKNDLVFVGGSAFVVAEVV